MSQLNRCLSPILILGLALYALFFPHPVDAKTHTEATSGMMSLYGNDRYETAAKIAQNGWPGTSDIVILSAGMSENLIDALIAGPLAVQCNAPILVTEGDHLNRYARSEINRLKAKKIYIVSSSSVMQPNLINEVKALPTVTEVDILGGKDPAETSVNVAKEMARLGQPINRIVLTGGSGADALSIAPFAGAQGMPILYSSRDSLPPAVKTYLENLRPEIAVTYVIGGPAVISESVKDQLPGTVKRYYGQDRYATNLEVLKQFTGQLKNTKTYVANGETLVDAICSVPLAVKNSSPILLTGNELPEESKNYALLNLSPQVVGLGGPSVVPKPILTLLASSRPYTLSPGKNPDSTTPLNAVNYPAISSITSTGAKILVQTNESGTAYYIVLANPPAGVPSAADVKSGTDGLKTLLPANRKGKVSLTANQPATITLTGLTPSTDYKVYIVSEDKVSNLQAHPVELNVHTSIAAPVIFGPVRNGDSTVSGTSEPGAEIVLFQNGVSQKSTIVSADGTWSIHNLTLSKNDVLTVTAQLPGSFPSDKSSVTVSGNTDGSILYKTPAPKITETPQEGDTTVSGTAPPGTVIVLKVNEITQPQTVADSIGNWVVRNLTLHKGDRISVTAQLAGYRLSDAVTQTVSSYPIIENITETSAKITFHRQENQIVSYVVLPSFAVAVPNNSQIAAGLDAANNPIADNLKGRVSLEVTNPTLTVSLDNLSPARTYNVYIAFPNRAYPVKLTFTTLQKKTEKPVIDHEIYSGDTTLSGTAPPNASVIAKINGVAQPAVTADSSGKWTVRDLFLFVGYRITVTAQTSGERVSDETTATVVARPGMVTPSPKILGDVVGGNDVSISGTAAANSKIVIRDANSQKILAQVTTGSNGTWKATHLTLYKGYGIIVTAQLTGAAVSEPVSTVIK